MLLFLSGLAGAAQAAVAVDDEVSGPEDSVFEIFPLSNDTQGDSIQSVSFQGAAIGTFSVSGAPSRIDYVPPQDFSGVVVLTYEACEGVPPLCLAPDSARIEITVTPVNDAPVAVTDNVSMPEDTLPALSIPVLDNDTDVENDPLTVVAVSSASHGSTAHDASSVTYAPDTDFNGADSFTYEITDGNGGFATGTVSVTVTPVNDAPVANDVTGGDEPDIAEDGALENYDPRWNDFDSDGDVFTIVGASTSDGAISFDANSVTFTPPANVNQDLVGELSFTYTVRDPGGLEDSATVFVDVLAVDDAPIAIDDPLLTVVEDGSGTTVDVLSNDSEVDGGTLAIVSASAASGTVVEEAPGVLRYTPNADFSGSDTITYEVTDGVGSLTATATVPVDVTAVDDAPVADADSATTTEEIGIAIDVLANDSSVDVGPLTIVSVTQGANGTVTNQGIDVDYDPNPDFTGTDTFTYTIRDGVGILEDTATVTVTVLDADDAPVAVDDTATTPEDVPLSGFDPLGNDSTVDSGTLFIASATAAEGTVTIAGDGLTLTWEPPENAFGTFTIEYVVQDTVGPSTDVGTITVTVGATNDVPIANDDAVVTNEDQPVTIDVLANDFRFDAPVNVSSAGRTLTIDGVDYPGSSGSDPITVIGQSGDAVTLPSGRVTIDPAGTITYTPRDDFAGTDFFEYEITDVDGDTATGRVDVTVVAVNDPPRAPDSQQFVVTEGGALTVPAPGVLGTAFDPEGDPLVAVLEDAPGQADAFVLNPDGSFAYAPTIGFEGPDFFTFFVEDPLTSSVTSFRIDIQVEPADPVPAPPPPGEVEFDFELAQVPLELVASVEPNVLVLMDDSGSMDFTTVTRERSGAFTLVGRNSTQLYSYFIGLPSNTYSNRGGIPSEEALAADNDFDGNTFGVWRARNHRYNRIYYNPAVRYRPWVGLAPNGDVFPDANPFDALLNPYFPAQGSIDLTDPIDYRVDGEFNWGVPRVTRNGREEFMVRDYYIPRYYEITDLSFEGEPEWNTPHELIEIRPESDGGLSVYPGGVDRVDCALDDGDPLTCTYEQELQNFANWFVYYRSREYTVKGSLGRVVADVSTLNLGFATINNNNSGERLAMQPMNPSFRDGAKQDMMRQIYITESNGGTPLRRALDRAGRYYECASDNIFRTSASSPGSANCPIVAAPAGACQQNFTLLFTDGEWNNSYSNRADNADGDGNSDFDGGIFADGLNNTLADVAMYYYERDLHPGLENLVPATARDKALSLPSALLDSGTRIHQHMTTFTVGFGLFGRLEEDDIPGDFTGSVAWGNPFSDNVAKVDDLRHAALNGRGGYLSAADSATLDQQLTAAFDEFVSGEGAASAVAFNSQQLQQDTLVFRAFYNTRDNSGDIVAQVIDETTNQLVDPPVWSAASELDERSPDSRVIVTWDDLAGESVAFRFGDLNTQHQTILDSVEMVDYLRGERSNENPQGRRFRVRPFTGGRLGDIVNSTPVFVGQPNFFLRDSLDYPIASGDLYSEFRSDNDARRGMVYVGANDGMLHAFDADTGVELFSYVPDKIISGRPYANDLNELTQRSYGHKYFVDGSPAVNDVFLRTRGATDRSWRTILVGSLRAGGKGIFALDVTDPEAFGSENAAGANVLWEFDDGDDTYPVDQFGDPVGGGTTMTDLQGLPVKDLGYTYSVPTIAMTNVPATGSGSRSGGGTGPNAIASPENKWAAVFGNGYNSTHGVAKLFVNFIEDGIDGWDDGDFVKLSTGFGVPGAGPNAGLPNGLGTPRLVDLDQNGTVDFAYAGDYFGNLFRFDMTSSDPANWTVTRIFRATYPDAAGREQPITTQPIVTRNPQAEGLIVIFATGSFITESDGTSTDIQSIYGIWDRIDLDTLTADTSPPTAAGGRAYLVEQEITNLFDPAAGAVRTFSDFDVQYNADLDPAVGVRGWVVDLDAPRPEFGTDGLLNPDDSGNASGAQFPGERAVRNLQLRGGFLFVNTIIPRDDTSCERSPGGFALAFNPVTGGAGGLREDIAFDLNNDGYFDSQDLAGSALVGGIRFDDAVPTDSSFIGTRRFTQLSDRSVDIRETNTGTGARSGRLSWREFE